MMNAAINFRELPIKIAKNRALFDKKVLVLTF